MKVGVIKRISKSYFTVGKVFGRWVFPIFGGLYLLTLRILNFFFMKLDWLIHPIRLTKKIKNPILIVGNPRSGTTFIHRYLSNNGLGTGSKLYQMIFPSIILPERF